MPERICVTSFIGVTTGLATPGGTSPSYFGSRFGNPGTLCASNLMKHQVFFSLTGTAYEHSSRWPQCLEFFGTPLGIEPSPSQLSGDAGPLPIRPFDLRKGPTQALTDALD